MKAEDFTDFKILHPKSSWKTPIIPEDTTIPRPTEGIGSYDSRESTSFYFHGAVSGRSSGENAILERSIYNQLPQISQEIEPSSSQIAGSNISTWITTCYLIKQVN